jgi:hypothetical protein
MVPNYQNFIITMPDVTSTLTTLVIDGIASHSSLLDSYVVLYAAFISSLHKIVGLEFGKERFVAGSYALIVMIS